MSSSDAAASSSQRLSPVVTSFIAGTVGGVFQAVVSHPFDTIKSRVQMGAPSISACIRDMVRTEGPLAAYKGVLPPIAVMGAYNSTLFSSNAFWTGVFTPASHRAGDPVPFGTTVAASVLTAPATAAVICPAEVIKVRLQLQQGGKPEFAGVLDCAAKTLRNEGAAAFTKGFGMISASRAVGLPPYFLAYNYFRGLYARLLAPPPPPALDGRAPPPPPGYVFMLAGVSAGVFFWLASYPFDLLKTRVQASKGAASPLRMARDVVKEQGPRGLYRGLGACLLRAVPANASVWFAMENTKFYLKEAGY
jgi:hypothetical protein